MNCKPEYQQIAQLALPIIAERFRNRYYYDSKEFTGAVYYALHELANGNYSNPYFETYQNELIYYNKIEEGLSYFGNFLTEDVAEVVLPIVQKYLSELNSAPGNMSITMWYGILYNIIFALQEVGTDRFKYPKNNDREYIHKVCIGLNLFGTHLLEMCN